MNDLAGLMGAAGGGGATPTLMDYINSIRVTADVGGGTISFGDKDHMQKKLLREYMKSLTGQPAMVPNKTPVTPTVQGSAMRMMTPPGMRMVPTMQQGYLNAPGLREMNSLQPFGGGL